MNRNERHYVAINYNKRSKQRVTVCFYTVINNGYFKGTVVNKLEYKYNNLYHFLKNDKSRIERCEAETGAEILENATEKDVLNNYNNVFFNV